MSHKVSVYGFEGLEIRAAMIDGEPWFSARDIAEALGYSNPQKAVRDHCKTTRPLGVNDSFTLGPSANVISERDVYRLIMRSKMPKAEQFEEWVVGEVIPSIRKTGSYSLAAQLPDFSSPAESARAWADQFERRQEAESALALAAPKVEFVDQYVENSGSMTFRQVAKLIKANERKLRQFLLDNRIQYKLGGNWTAYQNHIDSGRFEVKTGTSQHSDHAFTEARFTPKGVEYVSALWRESIKNRKG